MSPIEVLVTFYCRTGSAERLALAAAVGAVQARATIRLRRLPDTTPESPGCGEDITRMCKEYVSPTEADVVRADAIIFVAPDGFTSSAAEWIGYLRLLTRLGSEGKLDRKVATVLAETDSARTALSAAVLQIGFTTVPPGAADPTEQGRLVAAAAQTLKLGQFGG